MNTLPEEVTTFLHDRFATIRETCYHRDSYRPNYWRDATKMGQKMGFLLLKYPGLEDAMVLQILGDLSNGECRGLRLFLLQSKNGREILDHILQIHPTGRDIIAKGYLSYMFGRGYMGSILEDKNIYHWEDQAIKFFRTLISSGYDSELERDAYTRYAYQMAQRLRVIPGHDDYDAMSQDLTPFLCRMLGEDDIPSYEDIPTYIHAKFWAFYLFANPGRRTEETFQYLKDNWDEYDCAHILTVLEILDERVLEEPAVAHFHNEFGHYDEDEDLGVIV